MSPTTERSSPKDELPRTERVLSTYAGPVTDRDATDWQFRLPLTLQQEPIKTFPEAEMLEQAAEPGTEKELPNLTKDLTETEEPKVDRPITERDETEPRLIQPVTESPEPQREAPETLREADIRLPRQLREEPTTIPP